MAVLYYKETEENGRVAEYDSFMGLYYIEGVSFDDGRMIPFTREFFEIKPDLWREATEEEAKEYRLRVYGKPFLQKVKKFLEEKFSFLFCRLVFNAANEVVFDPKSRKPHFVGYNTVRYVIAKAKKQKAKFILIDLPYSVEEELKIDGYKVENTGYTSGGRKNKISWD
jgi:hypothetical protein